MWHTIPLAFVEPRRGAAVQVLAAAAAERNGRTLLQSLTAWRERSKHLAALQGQVRLCTACVLAATRVLAHHIWWLDRFDASSMRLNVCTLTARNPDRHEA